MVSNVKNRLLLVILLGVVVLSSSTRFSKKVTSSQINTICTYSGLDASFCFKLLKSSPKIAALDPAGLVKYLVNYDSPKHLDMLKQFQSLFNSTTDRSAKGSYQLSCDALADLGYKDYFGLQEDVQCIKDMSDECEMELSTFKPNPQLVKQVSNVKKLSHIIMVTVQSFLQK
ncbi:hypothetical protein CARUB_v10007531mg [Capsella rubella]|uniref:Pectinesterase inhibitor domain-containing protein n=1 Tax=Capsella rubella TaxID=81985 RepID=R0FAY8_9BRAS|nr:hypothetical protein CARUB_v10007531mg [Capsella rubella]